MAARSRRTQLALALLAAFVAIAVAVMTNATAAWDNHSLQLFALHRTPAMTRVMLTLSAIGNWQWEVSFALIVAVTMWITGRPGSARRLLMAGVAVEALYAILKLLFHRPRPTIITHLGRAGWYSFPSGHAMLAPVIWGAGLTLLGDIMPGVRWPLWSLACLLSAGIAVSRVYLGVHYPSDVAAGLCVGVACTLLWRERESRSSSVATLSAPAIR
jgi:undecaprenyl-diphosphatase